MAGEADIPENGAGKVGGLWVVNPTPRPGARLRLICVHHAGGSPTYFEAWPDLLPDEVEVLAVGFPGRGARRSEPLLRDLDTAVAGIVAGLTPYLDRPYAMFGDSIGALVCFEVIRYLRRAGLPLPARLFASGMVAPHIVWWNPDRPLHRAPDDELFQGLVRDAGMLDEKSLADKDLRAVMLPVLRADLEIAETYTYRPEPSLPVPVTAIRGEQDILLTPEQLEGWSKHTDAGFEHLTLPGNHFYSRDRRADLMAVIVDRLRDDLAKFPPSVADGITVAYPRASMHAVFSRQATATPNATALVYRDERYSYAELDRLTDAFARWLIHKGVRKGDLVGIFMERCADHVIALMAINKAGGVFMPLDTAYPPETLQRFAEASGARIFLTREIWLKNVPEAARQGRSWVMLDAGWPSALGIDAFRDIDTVLPAVAADDLAFVSMSSGTSGAPKGICQTHRASLNAYWHRYATAPYGPGEREACNVYFIWYVWLPILKGAAAYIVPDDIIFDPAPFSDFIRENRITRMTISPSLLGRILQTPGLDHARQLASLRNVTIIGEVVPTALIREFHAVLPDCTLTQAYGCAETHDAASRPVTPAILGALEKVASTGGPQANQRIYVLDENRQPLPRGIPGEIHVGGDSLAAGYFKDPANTAARFVPDPLRPEAGLLFKTGDKGRMLSNGDLQVFGRIDSMVKLRGYSVMLGVVSQALLDFPGIRNAVVDVAMDSATGRPDHLVAHVVAEADKDWSTRLWHFLKARLPHYAIPAFVVPLRSLPLDQRSNSKIDRKALPKPGHEHRLLAATERVPPRDAVEAALARAWCEVLAVPEVGMGDDFFALGGHSLLAAELCGRVNVRHGWSLRVIEMFRTPTIAGLAEHLKENGATVPA
ncbi:AMP-binding protein [Tabrizicola sp.]|jgi:amino acid adenylation domain-containing protein